MGAVLNTIVTPYGFSPIDATIIGIAFVLSGIFGSILFSYILDMFNCYVLLLKVITIATTLIILAAFYTLPSGSLVLFSLNMGLLGLFTVPSTPVCFSFVAEITFPVKVTLAQGIFLLITQIYGTGLSYLATFIIEAGSPLIVVAIVAA